MDVKTRRQWAAELAVLAAEDEALHREAAAQRVATEQALEAAIAREALTAKRAAASHSSHIKAQRWLSEQAGECAGPAEDRHDTGSAAPVLVISDPTPQPSVATIIKAFLSTAGEATYAEIKDEVGKTRSDIKAENCARDLHRLVKRGVLVKPRTGMYRLAEESDSMQS